MIVAFVLAAALAQAPAFPPATIWIVGDGNWSCATWLSDEAHKESGEIWVHGYFSGLNSAFGRQVGHATDSAGIIGEVEKDCRDRPSDALIAAAQSAFRRMAAADK